MKLVYKDNLDGYFSVATANDWFEENLNTSLPYYTIVLNFGAPIVYTKDFKEVQIEKNGIGFFSPGTFISGMTASDEDHCFIDFSQGFYCLELHDKEISCNGLLFGAIPDLPILYATEEESANNRHLIDIFRDELTSNERTQGEMLKLLLKRLIIKCVRLGNQQLFLDQNQPSEESDIIRQFQALVETHFRIKHKVGDYADLMFKSPKTLSNTFKKLQAKTPLQIIQERIILEAKRELHYSDKSIKEITYDLGFSEPAQFSRLFKKIAGVSPSEFQGASV